MLHFGGHTERDPPQDVVISCPACGGENVLATAYDEHQTVTVLIFLPIRTDVQTFVTCSVCSTRFVSQLRAVELAACSAQEAGETLRVYRSVIGQALALLAIVVSVAPFLGSLLAAIAILTNWRTRGWPLAVSMYALLLSALSIVWTEPFEAAMNWIAGY